MASSVRPRPNYYDLLGVPPGASQDEIGRAFVKGMGMFGAHPLATAARLSIAFETLRHPARRRAYDEAIGLRREPELRQWAMTVPNQTTRAFVASAPGPAEKAKSDTLARLQRLAEPQPLTRTAPKVDPPETPQPQSLAVDGADLSPIEWKRPAMTVGALLIAAGLAGALAGSSLLEPQRANPAARGPIFGRPVTKPSVAAPGPVAAQPVAELGAQPPLAPQRFHRPQRHRAVAQAPAPNSVSAAEAIADASAAADANPEQAAATPSAVESIAATDLPIAAKVMARTIERIGYGCGTVASASQAEGEKAGVYKVTCTSGDTYRAAPVGGRYHFRRWSRR
jgi:hypothetical protein